ncbi:SspB family protein [Paracraurococcus lichenis]|uniref:ClpXP protease specificity-enhancing factor SspB n=1 Tax=Paracraurococcus lichenis TaxID=3064888 RepID=A0ABT9E4Z3_9PROT|nr:ClpXP protease specificity-enhancing factor SspB [Paracraurococcus sp. LOR1-02]MDO9711211.1 ClpXP protease specificity-enhancing factor SspB [Paracraurococcus sp. LOR1-02]
MNDTIAATDSELPYAAWAEEALRAVVVEALDHVGRRGLPGEHHFYVTFRTEFPGVSLPGHLKARYPQEMTIVLQHKFWDLKVDRGAGSFSVGLSFGGVPAMLVIPFKAVTAFADPHVRFGLRFQAPEPAPAVAELAEQAAGEAPAKPQVVSLDAFRRRRD